MNWVDLAPAAKETKEERIKRRRRREAAADKGLMILGPVRTEGRKSQVASYRKLGRPGLYILWPNDDDDDDDGLSSEIETKAGTPM